MAFPLKDIRFTVRRSGGETMLYPRLVRDRSFLPKVDIAVQYFESMLGRERRDFQTEVLVHFFGDHKLARCMVASLARSYRFRTPLLSEIVTKGALRRLERAGISSPVWLRFALFDRLNDFGHGFLPSAERAATLAAIEAELHLRSGELERLLHLDSDEHALLTRVGAEPRPEDVVAQYNFGVLETLLRHAQRIELELARPTAVERAGLLALFAEHGIEAEWTASGRDRLALHGRQDAMGVWSRHGRRLARTVVELLIRVRPIVREGVVNLLQRDRKATLRLTPEALDLLSGPPTPCVGPEANDGWSQAELVEVAQALRGGRLGWSVRRLPDPQAWAAGVVLPDLLLRAAGQRRLVCAVRSLADAERLAPIARAATTGEPLLFVGPAAALGPLEAVEAGTVALASREPAAVAEALQWALDPARLEGLRQAS